MSWIDDVGRATEERNLHEGIGSAADDRSYEATIAVLKISQINLHTKIVIYSGIKYLK